MAQTIPLSRGYAATIDDLDFELASRFKWSAFVNRTMVYAVRNNAGKTIYLHRFLMSPGPGMVVDHINGNTLDNRRCNLRCCTPVQNQHNHRLCCTNKSGFHGVYYRPNKRKWQANLSIEGKTKYLGLFETKEQAALAWNVAAIEARGQFATLNQL